MSGGHGIIGALGEVFSSLVRVIPVHLTRSSTSFSGHGIILKESI